LRLHGITSLASANEFSCESYIAEFNRRFALAATQLGHAFLPVRGKNLDLIFPLQHQRVVNKANTVHLGSCVLQIEKSHWRATLDGCGALRPPIPKAQHKTPLQPLRIGHFMCYDISIC
jgi:hypothetical protein